MRQNSPTQDPVVIYTDGGCQPNPGIGGWAAVLSYQGKVRELSGGALESTNNRMELTACIEALRALNRPCRVELHTDSEYVKRGITEWLANWKRRGWRRGNQPVKNVDLWQALDAAVQPHDIDWRWVPGHAGVEYNERCDELAGAAIAALRDGGRARHGG